MLRITSLTPFGQLLECTNEASGRLNDLNLSDITSGIDRHRLLIVRGLANPTDDEMLAFCRQLGTILEWEFGSFNELAIKPDAKNYLYTHSAVPFHWDGAFVGKIPHYIFFHCVQADQGSGANTDADGATLFCDTPALLGLASIEQRARWQRTQITYRTEKVVHYGGSFSSPMLGVHPTLNIPVIRYAEPVDDLNPVTLEFPADAEAVSAVILEEMRAMLYDRRVCYAHGWKAGDIVIADNHALLHGRNKLSPGSIRHIRRINVL